MRRILPALICMTLLFTAACTDDGSDEAADGTDDATTDVTTAGNDGAPKPAGPDNRPRLADTPVCNALQNYLTSELGTANAVGRDDQAAKDAALAGLITNAANLKALAGDLTVPVDIRIVVFTRQVEGQPLNEEEQAAAKQATETLQNFRRTTCRIGAGLGRGGGATTTTAEP